jgi:hypothetical protein
MTSLCPWNFLFAVSKIDYNEREHIVGKVKYFGEAAIL